MNLKGKSIALYGRFSGGARERLADRIARQGGTVARDLTRRTDTLVVGALAWPLIETGRLWARLSAARARRTPVYGERAFLADLSGEAAEAPTLPLHAVKAAPLTREAIETLAAFDLVCIASDCCRFGDAQTLKTASDLVANGRSLSEIVKVLTEVRDRAPTGRRKVVLDEHGTAALQWEEGLTRLDGQGVLPLDGRALSVDDLFEAAALAECAGDLTGAEDAYERAARQDRKDAIAPYNLGTVRLEAGRLGEAALAFRQAIARDPAFVEARYNLAAASERLGKPDLAREQLAEALKLDPDYADALFNLAQLELKRGALAEAKMHFERYLSHNPPAEWAEKARRAILYCATALSA
jgi:tetratricopeptide (TPR) repeat protein